MQRDVRSKKKALDALEYLIHITPKNGINVANSSHRGKGLLYPSLPSKLFTNHLQRNPIAWTVRIHEHVSKQQNQMDSVSQALFVECSNIAQLQLRTHRVIKMFAANNAHGARVDVAVVRMTKSMQSLIQRNQANDALLAYEAFAGEHDDISNLLYLKACIDARQFERGKQLIDAQLASLHHRHIKLINTVMDFYAHSGDMAHALHIYHNLPVSKKDTVSLNVIINGCLKHRNSKQAIDLYHAFNGKHDDISNTLYLKACMDCNELQKAQRVVDQNMDKITYKHSIEFISTVMDFYGLIGNVQEVTRLFQRFSKHLSTMNAMMNCYIKHKRYSDAMNVYETFAGNKYDDVSNTLYLKSCINCKQFDKGQELIQQHMTSNQHANIRFTNTVIDFYGNAGNLDQALNVYHSIPSSQKDVISLSAIMNGCINNSQAMQAISLYQEFNGDAYSDVSNTLLLKACIHAQQYEPAQQLIAQHTAESITQRSIEFITTVIDFYGHTGNVSDALRVFRKLPTSKQNTICMNVMMNCCLKNSASDEAMEIYEQVGGGEHDDVSNVLYLKACVHSHQLDKAKTFVSRSLDTMHDRSIAFVNVVIDFYGEIGNVERALRVFNEIPLAKKDTVSFNSMMNCYMKNEQHTQAMDLYETCGEAVTLSDVSKILYLKCCAKTRQFEKGHALIEQCVGNMQEQHSIELINTVMDFYGHAGNVDDALHLFHYQIPATLKKNAISLNVVMNCCVKNQRENEALALYESFDGEHNDISKILYLKACVTGKQLERGSEFIASHLMHDIADKHGIELITAIMDFYGHIGNVDEALRIFDAIPVCKRDIVSLGSIMNACVKNNKSDKAMDLYEQHDASSSYDDLCNVLYLKSCINCQALPKAQQLVDVYSNEMHTQSIEFINTVLDFYGHIGNLKNALHIFDNIPASKKDIVSINNMMNCYVKCEKSEEAISLYETCVHGQYDPDGISNVLYLKACINCHEFEKGRELIDKFLMEHGSDFHHQSIEFLSTVIDFYGNTGDVNEAFNVFQQMQQHEKLNAVAIGAMMNVYGKNKEYEKALQLFQSHKKKIQLNKERDRVKQNAIFYSIALDCCGHLVHASKGRQIINELNTSPNMSIFHTVEVQSAIIRMYAKLGQHETAIEYFERLNVDILRQDRDGYIYTAIMDCYAKKGDALKVVELLRKLQEMHQRGDIVKISNLIYSIVINACSHSGLMDEAKSIYDEIAAPDVNVTTAIIDCYGRRNDLQIAEQIYDAFWSKRRRTTNGMRNNNPSMIVYYEPKMSMIMSILSACRIHNDVKRAQRIFEAVRAENGLSGDDTGNVDQIDDEFSSVYILMANIYAQNKQYEKVAEIRGEMKAKGLVKRKPAKSWIEIDGKLHTFVAAHNVSYHGMHQEIMREREILTQQLISNGYQCDVMSVTREQENDEQIQQHLCGHSERSALILGLLLVEPPKPIVIAKNLRVCRDCHNAIKLISKIRNRQIRIRDKNRWHTFEHGECDCRDFY